MGRRLAFLVCVWCQCSFIVGPRLGCFSVWYTDLFRHQPLSILVIFFLFFSFLFLLLSICIQKYIHVTYVCTYVSVPGARSSSTQSRVTRPLTWTQYTPQAHAYYRPWSMLFSTHTLPPLGMIHSIPVVPTFFRPTQWKKPIIHTNASMSSRRSTTPCKPPESSLSSSSNVVAWQFRDIMLKRGTRIVKSD